MDWYLFYGENSKELGVVVVGVKKDGEVFVKWSVLFVFDG